MTWRKDVYTALANVTLGFEQITDALKVLREAGILEDGTEGSMWDDLDNLWTGINYVILVELHARESGNQEVYDEIRTETVRIQKKLRARNKP